MRPSRSAKVSRPRWAEVLPPALGAGLPPLGAGLPTALAAGLPTALGAGLPTSPKPPTAGLPDAGDLPVGQGAGAGDPRTPQGDPGTRRETRAQHRPPTHPHPRRPAGPRVPGPRGLGPRSGDVSNEMLVAGDAAWTPEAIASRTGIEQRRWVADGETPLSLALAACRKVLAESTVDPHDIGAILCSTSTPMQGSPSIACQLLTALMGGTSRRHVTAFDFSAACSGYLYGLQIGHDLLQQEPSAQVLLVTVEVMSPLLDLADKATACLFGDAATATLLSAKRLRDSWNMMLRRPLLSAKADSRGVLFTPLAGQSQSVRMDGMEVAHEARRSMAGMLVEAVRQRPYAAGLGLADPTPGQPTDPRLGPQPSRLARRPGLFEHPARREYFVQFDSHLPRRAPAAPSSRPASRPRRVRRGFTAGAALLDVTA